MRLSINENKEIQLENVFNPVVLKTKEGEEMSICMRDTGFEFKYQGVFYSAKQGLIEPLQQSNIRRPLPLTNQKLWVMAKLIANRLQKAKDITGYIDWEDVEGDWFMWLEDELFGEEE